MVFFVFLLCLSSSTCKMIGMKVEYCLDGDTNFISWNSRVLLILEENDLLKFVNEKVS